MDHADSIRTYLSALRDKLNTGAATEHTHRAALEALLQGLAPGLRAINEPSHVACGAPDFVVTHQGATVGYVETKDVGLSLDAAERSDQLKRYREGLHNLILTDYLEFRHFVDGEPRATARLARWDGRKLSRDADGAEKVASLLADFLAQAPAEINTPQDLAERMARLAHLIREIIVETFRQGHESSFLKHWRLDLAGRLIAGLDDPERTPEFADMIAQTLAYGLFSARLMDTTPGFEVREAADLISETTPLLRDFFYQITAPQLKKEPFAPFVDDLVTLLRHTDMGAVLADFGKRTRQQDPTVHFYETFLAAYDPRLRETRGVYYTPYPVVDYIVRAVDHLLKERFGCPEGLADGSTISIPNWDSGKTTRDGRQMRKTRDEPKVTVLDPACGTGTFLYAVVDHIRQRYMDSGNAGMWPSYVRQRLLPRLFGFELLMAPYAVAHLKLALQLMGQDLDEGLRQTWAYSFADPDRIGVYLCNTLEEPGKEPDHPLFNDTLAAETHKANEIKSLLPIMVVLGNPPYSGHSANKGDWINGLLKGKLPDGSKAPSYYHIDGKPLGERNPKWLQDDYVKFIRWSQWRIERSGGGILAMITNHGYLDNPTFRGMRRALMDAFDEIRVLDLHGNVKKKEVAPDGGKDENVFDIQQGTAILLAIKHPPRQSKLAQVHHAELWGPREEKYRRLAEMDVETTPWQLVQPRAPFYLFTPRDTDLLAEYDRGWKITDVFPVNSVGVVTARDKFVLDFDETALRSRIADFTDPANTDEFVRQKYLSTRDGLPVSEVRRLLCKDSQLDRAFVRSAYRPFDRRSLFYHPSVLERSRLEIMRHMASGQNRGLHLCRQIVSEEWRHVLATDAVTDDCYVSNKTRERGYTLPLYVYHFATADQQKQLLDASPWPAGEGGRVPNLSPAFVAELETRLGLRFAPAGATEAGEFGPEDVLHYAYAVFHSPAYRARYAEFLKIDFPRLPLTADAALFRALCAKGGELVALHLMESPALNRLVTRFPVPGDNVVGKVRYDDNHRRVHINAAQYFEGVEPEVWAFQVGGYQVLDKWLKDRQGRKLEHDDLEHYQRIVVALGETMRLMGEIDEAIEEHGGWPLAA
ncbi:MAG: DNA methyltransferase [Chloroflexi bacterium]|nr:DNA methyltransferase [Chloroflexota bacterium]